MEWLASDLRREGPSVRERMSDMHFARKGRQWKRRKSLSSVEPASSLSRILKKSKTSSSQQLSPLFAKLPYEIRTQIFEYVLFDMGIILIDTIAISSIRRSFHKIRAQTCSRDLVSPKDIGYLDMFGPDGLAGPDSLTRPHINVALLQTCRRVYQEVIPLVYANTHFFFKDPRHLIALSHSIPRTHFQQIRSIRMDFSKVGSMYFGRREFRTFKIPLFWPMQEYFRVAGQMLQLRCLYIVFRIGAGMLPDTEIGPLLEDIQEYHRRTLESVFSQCKVHLRVIAGIDLIYESADHGFMEAGRPSHLRK